MAILTGMGYEGVGSGEWGVGSGVNVVYGYLNRVTMTALAVPHYRRFLRPVST